MEDNNFTMDLFGSAPSSNESLKGKRVFFTGTFKQQKFLLNNLAKEAGASEITGLSKSTSVIVMGENPQKDDCEKIGRLNYNGYYFPIITEEEFINIATGKKSRHFPKIKKEVNITYEFIFESPYSKIEGVCNGEFTHKLANKEIFLFDMPHKHSVWQLIGNLGGIGTDVFDPDTTDYIVLKQSTVKLLKDGIQDDLIRFVSEKYNKSKAEIFSYKFILEKDLFDFIKIRAEAIQDYTSLDLIKIANI